MTSTLDEELTLAWYGEALRRRWKTVLLITLLGAAAGGASASLRPVLFEGVTALVVLPPPRTPTASINPTLLRPALENASLAAKIIADMGLAMTPQTFLESALEIEQPAGTDVLRVKVRLADPEKAADASRRIAYGAIALTRRLNQEQGSSLQDQLKGHLDEAGQRRVSAEKELLSYQQHEQMDLLKVDSEALLAERGDLLKLTIAIESEKARLAAAETEIARQKPLLSAPRATAAEDGLRRVGASADPPPAGVADHRTLDLTNPYVNPVYQTLDFQIATSRTELAALEQRRRQIVDVRKIDGREFARLSELYRGKIEVARLEANLELARKVYGELLVRYEESRVEALGYSPQLQLVDEAIVPDRPMPLRRLQSTAMGLLAGLLGGGLIALMLEGRKGLVG